MPFTFAHPAIVLPLRRLTSKWFSLTGLVIGSMTPDFEYFIRMKVSSIYSHTWSGVFWFDVPLGIVLAFLFHNIVRNKLIDNLPIPLQERFSRYKNFNWKYYYTKSFIIVFASLFFGAISHILWDDFTHASGFFVQKYTILQKEIHLGNYTISIFKILQHASTLFGLAFIAWFIYKLPPTKLSTTSKKSNYWPAIFLLTLIILVIRNAIDSFKLPIGDIIVSAISAFLLSLLLYSAFSFKMRYKSY